MPYDEELGQIIFQYEKEYPYSSKVIYNRIKEWAAISFGSLNDVLYYENLESGKIILKGYFTIPYLEDVKVWFTDKESVNSARCSHTYIFTIVDNKLKINIINLNYEFNYYSYSASGFQSTFISTKDVNSLYPITKDKSMQWKSKLSLIQNTDKQINILANSLDYYINSYENDYKF